MTSKLARYYASTTYWDAQVGRLIAALKEAKQFDNTIFVIAGDNGLSLGEHGLLGKQNLYEFGGMHVPLIFAGPGIPKGETKSFAYLMDIYPTLCEMTGTPVPTGWMPEPRPDHRRQVAEGAGLLLHGIQEGSARSATTAGS